MQLPPPPKAKITSSVMLWTLKGSFEERVETAARSGIQSIQLVREHEAWSSADIVRVKRLMRSFRMTIDAISSTPNWKQMPVSMVDPAQRKNLLAEVERQLVFANQLEVPMALLMSGDAIAGKSREEQWSSLVESAQRAGDIAAKASVTLIVEPLNTRVNHKGYFLDTCIDGLRLIQQADHPNVRLLFDIYHEQVQSGNVTETLRKAMPFVKVFHVADNPGRNDPGTGEINYANIYREIHKLGYEGHIAMEYLPLGDPVRSLIRAVDSMRDALG